MYKSEDQRREPEKAWPSPLSSSSSDPPASSRLYFSKYVHEMAKRPKDDDDD